MPIRAKILWMILGIVVGIWVGVALTLILIRWADLQGGFFQFRLYEVVHTTVTVAFALFVAAVLNRRLSYDVRKRQILERLLDSALDKMRTIHSIGLDYVDNRTKENEKKLLRQFKEGSVAITLVIEMQTQNSKDLGADEGKSLQSDFLALKTAITNTPFGRKGAKYSEEQMTQFNTAYQTLTNKLYSAKIKIYA